MDAEDYVDAVYMVLAATDQVDGVCGLRKPGQLHALCRPPALWTLRIM